MKVATMSMFLLLGKSISALGGNSLLGRDLAKLYASDDSARKLASCYDVVMAAEQLMDQISGNTASCSSISSAYFCSVKCTVDTLCCGSICGNLEQKMHFDSSFTPQKESSCVHYSSDSSHGLSGKKRCTYFDYNAYGSVSDCRSTFRSQSCKSCTMCGSNIPGTQIPMATTDCSNIDGGDVLSYECSDVDEMEEMMDLALSCANPSKRPVQNEDLDEHWGNPSWEACNSARKDYIDGAEAFKPTCTCEEYRNGMFQLYCQDECKACAHDICYKYSLTEAFDEFGNLIAWENCDDDICHHERSNGNQCFSVGSVRANGGTGRECICSDECNVDCSHIVPGVVFDRCTGTGNYGPYEEYATYYYYAYELKEGWELGTCEASSSGASAGAIVGGVIGGIVAIAVTAGLIIFHRRRQGTVSTTPHSPPTKPTQSETVHPSAPVAMVQPVVVVETTSVPVQMDLPPMGANDV